MGYEVDADRTCMARLAVFTDCTPPLILPPLLCPSLTPGPRPAPPEPATPGTPGPVVFQCIFLDLCRTAETPRAGWTKPEKNLLSIQDMRPQRFAASFMNDDGPCTVQVYKWELETVRRSEFVDAMVDVDGLVLIQDVGKDDDGDVGIEERMTAICALIAEAKGLFEGDNPERVSPASFPVPVSVMTATLGGRVNTRSREQVKALALWADWIYSYISNLEHEGDIAKNIVRLVEKIEKRGPYRMRLVPGLVRPDASIPSHKTLSSLPSFASGFLPGYTVPSDPPTDVASGDPLGALGPIGAAPPSLASSSSLARRLASPKPSPATKAIPRFDDAPLLPTSTSTGSLPMSGSMRSLRPFPTRKSSKANMLDAPLPPPGIPLPPTPIQDPLSSKQPTPPPKDGSQRTKRSPELRISIPAKAYSQVSPELLARHRSGKDAQSGSSYTANISTVGQGDGSFMTSVERYKEARVKPFPPRAVVSPRPTGAVAAVPAHFDMEGPTRPGGDIRNDSTSDDGHGGQNPTTIFVGWAKEGKAPDETRKASAAPAVDKRLVSSPIPLSPRASYSNLMTNEEVAARDARLAKRLGVSADQRAAAAIAAEAVEAVTKKERACCVIA